MKKHIQIFLNLIKFNFLHELEYRKNFTIRLVSQIFYVLVQLLTINIFFNFTNSIGSWTQIEVLLLVGIFRLIEGLFHILVQSNLFYLPDTIRYGELDYILSKPINSLFMISLKKLQLYEITTFLSGVLIISFIHPSLNINLMLLVVFTTLGFICLYSVMLIISSLSFFIPKFTALSSIWDVISKTTRFPIDAMSRVSKSLIYLLAPLLVVVTLPSQILLGKAGAAAITLQVLATLFLSASAYLFFKFSIRHYSSASS